MDFWLFLRFKDTIMYKKCIHRLPEAKNTKRYYEITKKVSGKSPFPIHKMKSEAVGSRGQTQHLEVL